MVAGPQRVQVKPRPEMEKNAITGNIIPPCIETAVEHSNTCACFDCIIIFRGRMCWLILQCCLKVSLINLFSSSCVLVVTVSSVFCYAFIEVGIECNLVHVQTVN